MKKSSETTINQRVVVISKMLIKGIDTEEILQYVSFTYNLSIRQAYNYIDKAKEIIKEAVKKDMQFNYGKAEKRFEELFKLSLENKDYKTASLINKELINLQGLTKQQIEHSGEVKFICSVPD